MNPEHLLRIAKALAEGQIGGKRGRPNQSVLIANAGSVAAGSAGIAVAASELVRWIVVIASYFRDKFVEPQRRKYRDQGRTEGREEGREEVSQQWREWNQRRLQAQANGEEFKEPPPGEE